MSNLHTHLICMQLINVFNVEHFSCWTNTMRDEVSGAVPIWPLQSIALYCGHPSQWYYTQCGSAVAGMFSSWLCVKFQNDCATETDVVHERHFTGQVSGGYPKLHNPQASPVSHVLPRVRCALVSTNTEEMVSTEDPECLTINSCSKPGWVQNKWLNPKLKSLNPHICMHNWMHNKVLDLIIASIFANCYRSSLTSRIP